MPARGSRWLSGLAGVGGVPPHDEVRALREQLQSSAGLPEVPPGAGEPPASAAPQPVAHAGVGN